MIRDGVAFVLGQGFPEAAYVLARASQGEGYGVLEHVPTGHDSAMMTSRRLRRPTCLPLPLSGRPHIDPFDQRAWSSCWTSQRGS